MQLIKSVAVDHFRSIQIPQTVEMGHFTAIAGLNNSGKSNLLRALHLFFTGNSEPSVNFNFPKDYNLHDLKSKKRAKDIRVTVTFDLPGQFNFRTGLKPVKDLLGTQFRITKAWSRNSTTVKYLLGGKELGLEDIAKIDQFLALEKDLRVRSCILYFPPSMSPSFPKPAKNPTPPPPSLQHPHPSVAPLCAYTKIPHAKSPSAPSLKKKR